MQSDCAKSHTRLRQEEDAACDDSVVIYLESSPSHHKPEEQCQQNMADADDANNPVDASSVGRRDSRQRRVEKLMLCRHPVDWRCS